MWKLIIQLHGGKGSSTTNVQSYTPTAQETRLQQQAADYSEAVAPNALYLNNVARGLLQDSIGSTQVDYNALNNTAQSQIANAQNGVSGLINGELPSAYQQNMENSIKSGVQNSMGTLLTDLGNRGVLNSSVTDKGIADINDSASQAMTNAYTNNIGLLSQLYGQQNDTATSGITAGAAAQEAAQQPAINLWNASLGLNGATTGVLGALAGQGTTTATQNTSGGSGVLGGVLGSLANGYTSTLGSTWCFAGDTKVKTPDGDVYIKDIKPKDIVISIGYYGKEEKEEVYATTKSINKEDKFEIRTIDKYGDEHKVITSESQPLMQENGEYIKARDIMEETTNLKNAGKVIEIKKAKRSIPVYDLKLTGNNNYIANGFIAKGGSTEW